MTRASVLICRLAVSEALPLGEGGREGVKPHVAWKSQASPSLYMELHVRGTPDKEGMLQLASALRIEHPDMKGSPSHPLSL